MNDCILGVYMKSYSLMFLIILLHACATAHENINLPSKEAISSTQGSADNVVQEEYAVPQYKYTTREGIRLDTTYHLQLNQLGMEIKKIDSLQPICGTFGFYYDNKTNQKDKLYLGFDCNIKNYNIADNSYPLRAWNVIFKNLNPILLQSKILHEILKDPDIKGLVISFYWVYEGNEGIIIWIEKRDLEQFMQNKIMYSDLIARSTTTRLDGKIINLVLFQKVP